jgi:nitroreductase
MEALSALHTRTSVPRVTGPVPAEEALQAMFAAALRAPDHGQLRPWRFLRIEGESLQRLADLFGAAALADNPALAPEEVESARGKALRSPLVIACISRAVDTPKVPALEQDMATACATHAMLLAAHAQGIGAVWRTGPFAVHPVVRAGLGLAAHEKLIAFLYVGQPAGPLRSPQPLATADFVQSW